MTLSAEMKPEALATAATAPVDAVERRYELLPLSARTPEALRELAERYVAWLEGHPEASLGDVCYTAGVGRSHLEQRAALVVDSRERAKELLRALAAEQPAPGLLSGACTDPPKTAWLFTGQGSQYAGMARELYETQPVFRETLDHCNEVLRDHLERPLLEVMFDDGELINHTSYAQPALFALEMGLARLWQAWGLEPDVVLGHSVGQYAAACVAGVFSLEDGLKLLAVRGRLMGALPAGGRMAAVFADAVRVEERLDAYPHLSVAAYNGAHTVVSGPGEDVEALVAKFREEGVRCELLETSHAFHSELLEPALDEFEAYASRISFQPLQRTLVCNRTGKVLSGQAVLDAGYWRRQARQPVQYTESVQTLSELGCKVLLEVGPQAVLTGMALRAWPEGRELPRAVTSLRREVPDGRQIMEAVGQLYVAGSRPDFGAMAAGLRRRKLDLPTYPFQRRRYWPKTDGLRVDDAQGRGLLGARRDLASGDVVYTSRFSVKHQAWLRDHVIYGTVVVPGATYVGMALIAAELPAELQEVFFYEPIIFSDAESREVQLTLHTPEDAEPGTRTFQVHSRPYEDREAQWALNASGTLVTEQADSAMPGATESLEAILERLSPVRPQQLFDRFAQNELNWGPTWRSSLTSVWAGDGEAVGELRVGDELAGHLGDEPIHPVLLDLCTGVAGASLLAAAPESDEEISLYLPLKYERVVLNERMPRRFFCHVKWQDNGRADSETQAFDLDFLGTDGRRLGGITNFIVKRAPRQALLRGLGADSGRLLYRLNWRELPVTAPTEGVDSKLATWLVVAPPDAPATDALRRQLLVHRQRMITVELGKEWRTLDEDRLVLDPNLAEHWQEIVKLATAGGEALTGIVWQVARRASAQESSEELLARLEMDVTGLLGALQNVLRSPLPQGLWIVTERAVAAEPGERVDPVQSAFWGLGRTIAAEQPTARCTLVDHDGSADALRLLADLLLTGAGEPELALRQRKCLVPRVMPWARSGQLAVPAADDYRLDPGERGAVEQLQLAATEVAPPEPGYVQVRVEAAGLNFRDVLNTLGLYPGDPGPVGGELAGVVTAVGDGVEEFRVGQRVFGFGPGAFASRVNVPYPFLAPLPSRLSAVEATTTPATMLTAGLAFEWAKPRPGERVLIHAASGGVGMAAIQLARNCGAIVFATASKPKQKMLRDMGVEHVYDSRSTTFAEEILADTGGAGVDVVLNSLTNEGFVDATVRATAKNGRFVEIAKLNIWSREQMAEARPDISYEILALDEVMQFDPGRIKLLMADLAAKLESGEVDPLPYQVYPLTEAKAAFRFMQQARHIGKIVLQMPAPLSLKADRSYLITGGLGALGLCTAAYLAQMGAGHIVLTSRREPDAGTQKAIDEIASQFNCQIYVMSADVSQAAQVAELLGRIRQDLPPLAGVAHLAGVLDDALLPEQSWQRFITVMAPKALGALHLDRLTKGDQLDFFLLYSSASSVLGSPGQANYASANALLDGLAAQRQALGLPAASVNWGPWAEAGMAATDKARANLSKQGLIPLKPAAALAAVSEIVSHGTVQATVINANWQRSAKLFGSVRPPILEHVLPRAIAGATGDNALLRQLHQVPVAQRGDFVTEHLQRELQQILGLAQPPSPESRFLELGMDSLMAVELRNRLLAQFGSDFTISSTVVFDYPTIRALAVYLASQSPDPAEEATSPAAAEIVAAPSIEGLRNSVAEMVEKLRPLRELGIELQLGETDDDEDDAAALEQAILRREAEAACREVMTDAVLPDEVRPAHPDAPPPPRRHALLTGATGYVGGFLLRDLLRANTRVTCIVRCQSPAEGMARIAANLKAMGIWEPGMADQLRVIPGDIEQARFGLAQEPYAALSNEVDSVFHCAASVRAWSVYSQLRSTNVIGTRQIVEFVCEGGPKVLHLLSTTGVFLARPYSRQAGVPEGAFPDSPLGNVFGYGQSKWAAESLARQAQARGAHVVIYRPGSILGATDGGFWSPRDLATVFTSHELATGRVNEEGRVLEGLPVDVVSRFIEASSADPAACDQTFHLVHPRPIGADTWTEALTRRGVPARRVSNEEWVRDLAARAENEMFRPLFELRGIGVNATLLECLPELPSFDSSSFQRRLAAYDIACPDYEALIEQGWLDSLLPG